MNRAAGMQPLHVAWRRRLSWARLWPALPALAAVLAVPGLFSTTRIFYVRDLAFGFWPLHLWLRHTVLEGESLCWDPYVGMGAPTASDPIRQLAFAPGLLLRLALPEVLGFNLWVALPFPIAGVGAYLLCRRFVPAQAAALGGALFAAAGPTLSTGNFPNLAWTISLAPWVLWSAWRLADRPCAAEFSSFAVAIALQLCAAEPVTACVTAAIAVAAPVVVASGRSALARCGTVLAGVAAGALLAGFYTFPLIDAASRSMRTPSANPNVTGVWSIHPLAIVETVAPFLFGDTITHGRGASPLVAPLNGGLEPYLFSIYVGVPALALACAGLAGRAMTRRARAFWLLVLLAGVLCALGAHTPVYPAIQALLPITRAFRSPSKYLLFATLALSILSAGGWQALATDARARIAAAATALAIALAALLLFGLTASGLANPIAVTLADWGGVDAARGSPFLVEMLASATPRLSALSAGSALLIAVAGSGHRLARACQLATLAVAVADPLAVNAVVNPQIDARALGRPDWADFVAGRPEDRIYVAGRLASLRPFEDDWRAIAGPGLSGVPAMEANARGAAALATFTSPWQLRDAITTDLAAIRPREYTSLLVRFAKAPLEAKRVFLGRVAVRFHLTSVRPGSSARRLADLAAFTSLTLYETPYALPRAFVVAGERVEPSASRHQDLMFSLEFDPASSVLLLEAPPPAAGDSRGARDEGAAIVEDGASRVAVDASTGENGGYLVLSDSHDPDWRATVDGEPARVLLANGNFRAVRLAPGAHRVVFEYRPRALVTGLWVTLTAAVLLGAWVAVARRRAGRERER